MTTVTSLSFDLGAGERLLWSGIPRQGIVVRTADALLVPFSVMWGGFAIIWELTVLRRGLPWFFALWGVPFVLVGLYIMIGRFFYDSLRRRRTAYGLTTERVILVSGVQTQRITSLSLATLTNISVEVRDDGSGTISFGPTQTIAPRYRGAWTGAPVEPSFELIADARHVYEMLREAQAGELRPTG